MAAYFSRIEIEQEFAENRLDDLGNFWYLVSTSLSYKNPSAKLGVNRFTFATFTLEAQNKEECRAQLTEAFVKNLDKEGIREIYISELPEDPDKQDLVRAVYNSYYGASDYMELITDLNETIPLLAERSALDILRGQSYLFAVDGGCGFTTLIRSFSDYLRRMHVYKEEEYDQRTYYYENKLGKESSNGFIDADDFIEILSNNQEKNPYSIIALDISYFLDGRKFDDLRRFLNRLDKYQDDYIFAFRVPFLEKKALDEIASVVSDQLLMRTVQIPPLPDCVLMETVWNTMRNKEYVPDTSVIEVVRNKIQQEKTDGRFYGFKTAVKIGSELILEKSACEARKLFKGLRSDNENITSEDVAGVVRAEKNAATGYDALSELIGMEEITQRVKEIVAQVKVAISNDKLDRPCIHMRFTGSPGTGKTTVARIIGQILREEGVLRKGGFFEYEARELVAEYEGQTAVKTAAICRDAYGSVLFIDEAYALNEGNVHGADFGKEALATLVAEMENHRDDMLVVMAGYEKEMDDLMKVNPGMRSRMPYILHFPNYTKQQLFEIYMLMVRKHFQFDPELEAHAHSYFLSLSDAFLESKEFANARFARNLYERTWSKGALRCSLAGKKNIVLIKDDFVAASSEKEFNEKIETKKKVGFATT